MEQAFLPVDALVLRRLTLTDRGIDVMVNAGGSEPTAPTAQIDSHLGLRRQLRVAPAHRVVLQVA